jgi:hypothetical protein
MRTIIFAFLAGLCVQLNSFAAPPGGAGGNLIQDKAVWNPQLFQFYCKESEIDVKDTVAPYPGQELITADFNPEFVKRLNALISYYQATGNNDIGIVPGEGAFRSPEDQHQLYKIGRVLTPGTSEDDPDNWTPDGINPISTGTWIGWHNFGLATDFCQYDGAAPKQVPVPGDPKKKQITLPFFSKQWQETFQDVAPDLGFIWGGRWHVPNDPAHIEWHPGRHNPAVLQATGLPDPEFSDQYTSKIPQNIYAWSTGKTAGKDAQLLWVFTLVYDTHWVALSKLRRISLYVDGSGYSGQWNTFAPPLRVFPGYVPIRFLNVSGRKPAEVDAFAYNTKVSTSTMIQYAKKGPDRAVKTQYSSIVVTARFCPTFDIYNWQYQAIKEINEASAPPKPAAQLKTTNLKSYNQQAALHATGLANQKKLENEYALCEDHSAYDVDAGAITVRPPSTQPYIGEWHGIEVCYDGYTDGDPYKADQEQYTPGDVHLHFFWMRSDGRLGVQGLRRDQKKQYDPLVITTKRVHTDGTFEIISPTLPDGAFDMEDPLPWPRSNPRPQLK